MSTPSREQSHTPPPISLPLITNQSVSYFIENACTHYEDGHCLTCSDQAIPVKVLHVNHEAGLALVAVGEETEEIDITLVDNVIPGNTLLAHGGVAIEHLDEESNDGD
jgi:hydrogenase maturation factor